MWISRLCLLLCFLEFSVSTIVDKQVEITSSENVASRRKRDPGTSESSEEIGLCVVQYQEELNQGADGATHVHGVFGKDNCTAACTDQYACVAVDVLTSDNSCWLFFNVSKASKTVLQNDTNHYTKIEVCDNSTEAIPMLTSLKPVEGIQAGGTRVTLQGHAFPASVTVIMGHLTYTVPCSSTHCVLLTKPVEQKYVDKPLVVGVAFEGFVAMRTNYVFYYRSNPVVEDVHPLETLLSGGTTLTVEGRSFAGVGDPRLEITMVHIVQRLSLSEVQTDSQVFDSDCSKESPGTLKCQYPELLIPKKFRDTAGENVISADKTSTKTEGADFQIELENERLDFYIGFYLDGDKTYKNLSESLPEKSTFLIYAEPPMLDHDRSHVYYADMILVLTGRRLRNGISMSDYVVALGTWAECAVTGLSDNELLCKPPHVEVYNDSDARVYDIIVSRGSNLETVLVGSLHYRAPTSQLHVIAGVVGGLGCLALIITVIVVIVVCLRSKKKAVETVKNETEFIDSGTDKRVSHDAEWFHFGENHNSCEPIATSFEMTQSLETLPKAAEAMDNCGDQKLPSGDEGTVHSSTTYIYKKPVAINVESRTNYRINIDDSHYSCAFNVRLNFDDYDNAIPR